MLIFNTFRQNSSTVPLNVGEDASLAYSEIEKKKFCRKTLIFSSKYLFFLCGSFGKKLSCRIGTDIKTLKENTVLIKTAVLQCAHEQKHIHTHKIFSSLQAALYAFMSFKLKKKGNTTQFWFKNTRKV